MSGIIAQNTLDSSGLIKAPAGGGAWNFISKQTASSSSTISFTSGIDSTYKTYVFTFNNIHPSADSNLQFQTSTDGGSSYGVTATTTFFYASHQENDGEAILSYKTNRDLAQSTDFQYLTGDNMESDDADDSVSGHLFLFSPSDTTFAKHFMSNTDHMASGPYQQNNYSAGYFNTTSAIDAVQFKLSAGSMATGDICLYGISTT